jgi:hypothetical protein
VLRLRVQLPARAKIFLFFALSISAVVPIEHGTAVKRPLCVVVPVDTIQMSYAFDKRRGAVCKGKCAAGICFVPALQMLLHF